MARLVARWFVPRWALPSVVSARRVQYFARLSDPQKRPRAYASLALGQQEAGLH